MVVVLASGGGAISTVVRGDMDGGLPENVTGVMPTNQKGKFFSILCVLSF